MGHTKEPWRIEPATKKDNWRIVAFNGQVVSTFSGNMDMDNARRIVACVNACEGLSTDLLEKAAITAAHIKARERLSFCTQQIEAERDQLKAMSVENILIDMAPGHDGMGQEVYAKSVGDVNALLSKLSGKVDELEIQRDELQSQLATERASLFAENQRKQQLEQQRDELLASLGAASNYIDHLGGLSNGYRAVIQKVRGGE